METSHISRVSPSSGLSPLCTPSLPPSCVLSQLESHPPMAYRLLRRLKTYRLSVYPPLPPSLAPSQLESHAAPWEDSAFEYPGNLAPPLQVSAQGSLALASGCQGFMGWPFRGAQKFMEGEHLRAPEQPAIPPLPPSCMEGLSVLDAA